MPPIGLSKSRIIEGLQCPRRLWLKVYKPELAEWARQTQDILQAGLDVHDVFRGLYPGGVLIEGDDDLGTAMEETSRHMTNGSRQIFEGTFAHEGVLIRADFLEKRGRSFRVHEVKSSATVKEHHHTDTAIQYWVLSGCGLPIKAFNVAHNYDLPLVNP